MVFIKIKQGLRYKEFKCKSLWWLAHKIDSTEKINNRTYTCSHDGVTGIWAALSPYPTIKLKQQIKQHGICRAVYQKVGSFTEKELQNLQ